MTEYSIEAPVEAPLRIVQLTDLHGKEFGEGNRELIDRVRELKPEMIFVTGDMLNDDGGEPESFSGLLEKLVKIAPVYVSYGNQETSWQSTYGKELRPIIEKTGAVVLDREYLDLEIKGNALRLGGYSGYYRAPRMETEDRETMKAIIALADEYEDTDRYKILLCHIPTVWLDGNHLGEYDVDLVFCGHYHGGQIRLPLIGGLYAPYVGWFPPYTKGLFTRDGSSVVLSAGLGAPKERPRINNPGEIVCLDLLPEK